MSRPAQAPVLTRIVERTRSDLATRMASRPRAELERDLGPSDRSFEAALRADGVSLIAEFKPASPSRGPIRPEADPAGTGAIYGRHAAAMSVLCDEPFFGGGYQCVAPAREASGLPILCKDFIVDEYQVLEARAAGADAVLLMASVLDDMLLEGLRSLAAEWGMDALVETHDDGELERALRLDTPIIGVNARDLHTMTIDRERALGLLDQIPGDRLRVAESGFSLRDHVEMFTGHADAVLIGSAFMEAPDIEARIEAMGW